MSEFKKGFQHGLGRSVGTALVLVMIGVGVYVGTPWLMQHMARRAAESAYAKMQAAKDAAKSAGRRQAEKIEGMAGKAAEATESAREQGRAFKERLHERYRAMTHRDPPKE